jgi:hypothetical protein
LPQSEPPREPFIIPRVLFAPWSTCASGPISLSGKLTALTGKPRALDSLTLCGRDEIAHGELFSAPAGMWPGRALAADQE